MANSIDRPQELKAIARERYGSGDELRWVDVERPAPGDDEVLIRVRASSVNRADRYAMQGTPIVAMRPALGFFRPRRPGLGMDFAGDVAEVGANVTDIEVGDAVYGQQDNGATWAEYACVPAALVAPKPPRLSYEEAGAAPLAGLTALQGLRNEGEVQPGKRVLINGGTGAVGTFAVQIAKALGADELTVVCGGRNEELVRSLGADHVIAYETNDFLECGRTFDVLFDVVGNRPLRRCCDLLEPDGVFVPCGMPEGGRWFGPVGHVLKTLFAARFVKQDVKLFVGTPNRPDLLALTELIESGAVTPAIDRAFPLSQTAEAMRYLVDGRPSAKVVLKVDA